VARGFLFVTRHKNRQTERAARVAPPALHGTALLFLSLLWAGLTSGAPRALESEERRGTESGNSGLEAAVLATVVEERFAIVEIEGFHFTDEDGVVAGHMLRDYVAGEMSQSVFEQRNARVRPPKANPEAGIVGRILLRIGKEFGKMLLGIPENTDAEATLRFEIGKKARILIHADKDQKRVEGNGGE